MEIVRGYGTGPQNADPLFLKYVFIGGFLVAENLDFMERYTPLSALT